MSDGSSEVAAGTYFNMKPILVQREKWERSKGGQLMEIDNIAEQVEWEKQQSKDKRPCDEQSDKQIDEFVKELRLLIDIKYYDWENMCLWCAKARINLGKAADTIKQQQNKCRACETYYEDTIKTLKDEANQYLKSWYIEKNLCEKLEAEIDRLKEAGNGD